MNHLPYNKLSTRWCLLGLFLLSSWLVTHGHSEDLADASATPTFSDEDLAFFESRVRPLLIDACYKCHSAQSGKTRASLAMDSRAAILAGGDSGPAAVPGDLAKSRMIQAIHFTDPDLAMPESGKLDDDQIKIFDEWVQRGLPWPKEEIVNAAPKFDLEKRKATHWSWQPPQQHDVPTPTDPRWTNGLIDPLIYHALQEQKLTPAPKASKRELIRRATFDLTGLPPTPQEIDAFLADASKQAYTNLIDRLLASTHFGEKWASHWLDLVRYAEGYGHEFDFDIYEAWQYRDYLIRAFNDDLPYDQFVREHLIGDQLTTPRRHPKTQQNESVLATGFYWLGEQTHSPVDTKRHQHDRIDNQIDVLTKTFQAMTVSCARCHDHKFDAISQDDYYALYGIIESTRLSHQPIDDPTTVYPIADAAAEQMANIDISAAHDYFTALNQPIKATQPLGGHYQPADSKTYHALPMPSHGTPNDWRIDGGRWTDILVQAGQPVTHHAEKHVLWRQHPLDAIDTSRTGTHYEVSVRSPRFTIKNRYVYVLVSGEQARVNFILNGFKILRNPLYGNLIQRISKTTPKWIRFDLQGQWTNALGWKDGIHEGYLEFMDLHSKDPAHNKPGTDIHSDNLDQSHLQIYAVVFSNHKTPPPIPSALQNNTTLIEHEHIDAQSPAVPVPPSLQKTWQTQNTMPQRRWALAAAEGTGIDSYFFKSGSHLKRGHNVKRRFLSALTGMDNETTQNLGRQTSGRHQIAESILDPNNPLTARVMVNRLWHHLFGKGLVATVDNFGELGKAPSHPKLLDHLALDFVKKNWSIKQSLRQIMLSEAYQMSSRPNGQAEQIDPTNQLIHRQNNKRLTAESIRDAMLFSSDRFDPTPYGPPVPTYLTNFMQGRGRPNKSGPLDGAGRRTIYLSVRRNFLSPMLLAFDRPIPFSTMGRRNITNVPSQALVLLNNPLSHQLAQQLAEQLIKNHQSTSQRILAAYQKTVGRPPAEHELTTIQAYLKQRQTNYQCDQNDPRPWADYCHALFNLKEFIYIP